MLKPLTMQGRLSCGLPEATVGKLWAFTAVMAKDKGDAPFLLGVAIANEPGYYPISSFWAHSDSYEEMSAHADELNRAEGLEDKTAMRIVCSTMRPLTERRGAVGA
jgi:hypothetical protein